MPFNKILKEAYRRNTSLRLARIKVDPLLKDAKDFAPISGYEGYVLEENGTICTMYVVDTGEQMEIPKGHMGLSPESLDGFKKKVIEKLRTQYNLESNAAELKQVYHAADSEQIEQVLRGLQIDGDEITSFYRDYVNGCLGDE